MRKILALLFVITLLASLAPSAYAHDYVRMDQEGSITLELQYEGEPVIGGKFACTKVAEVIDEDGNLYFKTLLEEEICREGIPAVSDMEQLVTANGEFFREQKQTVSNESGTVVFSNLLPGLYLVTQETEATGYSKMSPFLVSVPYLEEGVYVYDVTARTKTALEQEVPETTQPEEPEDPGDKLPQTGQLHWPVPVLAVSGLTVFVLGWYLRFGRKKDGYEK